MSLFTTSNFIKNKDLPPPLWQMIQVKRSVSCLPACFLAPLTKAFRKDDFIDSEAIAALKGDDFSRTVMIRPRAR